MTLQSSGAITLADIQAEFGGPTGPILLSNYYRGGTYVPDVTANAAIPTSGAIYLSNFYGASAVDFVPAALDWTGELSETFRATTDTQTISGINQTVDLEVTISAPAGNFYYILNGTVHAISTGGSFNVVNGDDVRFRMERTGGTETTSIWTIKNASSGHTVLDGFTLGVNVLV